MQWLLGEGVVMSWWSGSFEAHLSRTHPSLWTTTPVKTLTHGYCAYQSRRRLAPTPHTSSLSCAPSLQAHTRLSARLREKSHPPQTLLASATFRLTRTHAASCLRQKPPAPVRRRPARAVWVPCFNHHNPIVAMCAPPVQTTLASRPRMIHTTRNPTAIHERTGVRLRRL